MAVPVHLTPAGGARTVRVFTPPTYGRAWRLGARLGDVLAFLYGR